MVVLLSFVLCLIGCVVVRHANQSRSYYDLHPKKNRYKLCAETLIGTPVEFMPKLGDWVYFSVGVGT